MRALFLLAFLSCTAASASGHTNLVSTNFPAPFNSEPAGSGGPPSAAEAARRFLLPDGLRVTIFASEPDVQNPIACAWDSRGRLWVAENYTYADRSRRFERGLRDRVLIFEDTDGDGRHDRRSVFTDDVQMLTSVELGLGGAWMLCPPQLLFFPDRDRDDRPDGPPTVMLDGFTVPSENYHNFANGLRWGPDGWLYGRCGASSPGEVGRPGATPAERVPVRGGIWRYHPGRRVFEALAHGTTNPWGHDWDRDGELFYINTVNGHLWHVVPGQHFVRPHTIDPNPRVYAPVDHHADHWHFDTGKGWVNSRDGQADALGGGHAHVGMMIYQGTNWPERFRHRLLTLNMHGRRVNVERLERSGSGYVGRHDGDILKTSDPWFRGMELSQGPDGGVYVLDWSDFGECHESTGVHRTSGRIYKVVAGHASRPPLVESPTSFERRLEELSSENGWLARMAQRELEALVQGGGDLGPDRGRLREAFRAAASPQRRLRLLWAIHAAGEATPGFLRSTLGEANEHVRAWAVRLLSDQWPLDTVMSRRPATAGAAGPDADTMGVLVRLAESEGSGLVRLVLASTLQRLPVGDRPRLAAALLAHPEDAEDHNLPALIWFGLIPVAESTPGVFAELANASRIPATVRWMARCLAEDYGKNPEPLGRLLAASVEGSEAPRQGVLAGLAEGFRGWRKAPEPAGWKAFALPWAGSTNADVRSRLRELEVLFGDGRALTEVRRVALDGAADLETRRVALQALIDAQAPDARAVCEQLLKVRFLNATAVRGLGRYDDPDLGELLAQSFRSFHPSERPALLETLVSRPGFAAALLDEIGEGRIPREELSAFHARQIRGFNDPALRRKLAAVWGEIQESGPDKRARIDQLRRALTPENLLRADKSHGRALFNLACAVCHRLYGYGGDLGPDLTGAGRDNLDYLLENVIDPSAVVSADFKVTVATLKDGRVFNGVIMAKSPRTLTLRLMNGPTTVELAEIEEVRPSDLSLMPEGLIDGWPEDHVRDLVGYLMHPVQVALPARP